MSDQQSRHCDAAPNVARLPRPRKVGTAVCLLAGLALAVAAVYYAHLNINPPAQGQGDIDFGDGTGFVLGALVGIPAVVFLAAGVLVPVSWRRRRRHS